MTAARTGTGSPTEYATRVDRATDDLEDSLENSLPLPVRPGHDIDDLTIRVYEWTLSRHTVTVAEVATWLDVPASAVERSMRVLRDLRLMRYCASRATMIAVSPETAQLELALPLEQAIHDKHDQLSRIHQALRPFTDSFMTFQRARPHRQSVVVVRDRAEIEARLADAARHCTTEMFVVWPVHMCETPLFSHVMGLVRDALRRGVQTRIVYPHTARSHATIRPHLQRDAADGALVRTCNELSDFLVIADRQVALLQHHAAGYGNVEISGIYEPRVVNHLRHVYENIWQSGKEFDAGDRAYGDTLDEVKITILRMLAAGLKDEVIARRVGIAPRTLRRHIATIMEELGANSRFQAGVAAANAELYRDRLR
ncbi:helix-turn-helix transcriptional regulator [Streptomyces marincola]|uniref:HTH luxR-type domain-containing protein n=1 Tax=Streptomyces marincola TaxID=2878388 RepID=A0A1W7CUH4_9ACTN|nr:helix-turn-helix transcriptional regulator [Streptomyces marincola]ARQ68464.1 hypothetical protein CAG99_05995 [Streptomyces marincola]